MKSLAWQKMIGPTCEQLKAAFYVIAKNNFLIYIHETVQVFLPKREKHEVHPGLENPHRRICLIKYLAGISFSDFLARNSGCQIKLNI